MFHQQIFTSFIQQQSEPFYNAQRRFNELVEQFANHSLSNYELTLHFYNDLDEAIRNWVDYGAWAISDHVIQRDHEDAIHLLNDMTDFIYHWYWDPSLQGWSQ